MSLNVLVRGAGEHATATAHRLFRCGLQVVMTEVPEPTAVRRTVSFCAAVRAGRAEVEGVTAVRWELADAAELAGARLDHVAVLVDPEATVRGAYRPDAVVDARILKSNAGNALTDAALVVGLGPGLVAGRDVHVVVETARGHHLGRLLYEGAASADTGVPGDIGGYGSERVLRAPCDGVVTIVRDIGDRVAPGELLCRVGRAEVRAPIAGVLRGLIHPGMAVPKGLKIGDVDPRGEPSYCTTMSDKARAISGAVLEAVLHAFRDRLA